MHFLGGYYCYTSFCRPEQLCFILYFIWHLILKCHQCQTTEYVLNTTNILSGWLNTRSIYNINRHNKQLQLIAISALKALSMQKQLELQLLKGILRVGLFTFSKIWNEVYAVTQWQHSLNSRISNVLYYMYLCHTLHFTNQLFQLVNRRTCMLR